MKDKFYKFRYAILQSFGKLLVMHKVLLCIFCIVFLVCFITGIMTCVSYLDVVSCENLINEYLLKLLQKKSTYLGFFLIMTMWFCVVSFLAIVCTKNWFFVCINFVSMAFFSYVLGFDVCIVVMTLGLAGVIYGVLFIGIGGIILLFLEMLIMSLSCKKFMVTKNVCNRELSWQYWKVFLVFLLLGTAIIFLFSILFSSIHIFIIVD